MSREPSELELIARIIDPRPFEPRSGGRELYGDSGRRLQAMRKAEKILELLKQEESKP